MFRTPSVHNMHGPAPGTDQNSVETLIQPGQERMRLNKGFSRADDPFGLAGGQGLGGGGCVAARLDLDKC